MPRTAEQNRAIYRHYLEHGLSEARIRYGLTKDQVLGIAKRAKDSVKRQAKRASVEGAEELRRSAIKYARKKHPGEVAEDFASYCVIRHYEGRVSALKFMLTDFLRMTYGDKRYREGKGSEISQDEFLIDATADRVVESLAELRDLEPMDRAAFLLHFKFGLLVQEIAWCFGVTGGAVSHRLTKIKEELYERKT